LTVQPSLLRLARTYLEPQARLWPDLAGTPAVPTVTAAVVEAMADDVERRFAPDLRPSNGTTSFRAFAGRDCQCIRLESYTDEANRPDLPFATWHVGRDADDNEHNQ
jgi:hypothetical protein